MITLTNPNAMPGEQLTATQWTTLTSLVPGKWVAAGGEAGERRNRVHRWLKNDEHFQEAKRQMQREAHSAVEVKLHWTATSEEPRSVLRTRNPVLVVKKQPPKIRNRLQHRPDLSLTRSLRYARSPMTNERNRHIRNALHHRRNLTRYSVHSAKRRPKKSCNPLHHSTNTDPRFIRLRRLSTSGYVRHLPSNSVSC